MTSNSELKFRDDYKDKFDVDWFLGTFYGSSEGAFLPVLLNLLHDEFNKLDKHKGTRLLDLGTGPAIHSIISVSKVYTEITLSDYSESNRKQLQQWINREQGAHDWMPIISFVASLEGNLSSPETIQDRVLKSIQEVLPCDVLQSNPLHPNSREPYDCVVSSLCLEVASNSLDTYKESVKHLSSLLKPSGICVVVGVLEESFYEVGKFKFFALKLSASDIKSSFRENGFTDINLNCWGYDNPEWTQEKKDDCTGFFVMSARKCV